MKTFLAVLSLALLASTARADCPPYNGNWVNAPKTNCFVDIISHDHERVTHKCKTPHKV